MKKERKKKGYWKSTEQRDDRQGVYSISQNKETTGTVDETKELSVPGGNHNVSSNYEEKKRRASPWQDLEANYRH
jgi:hypothetical protein